MGIKPILLDTNAYTAFKKGVPQALEIVRRAPLIGLNSIILGELLGGFYVGGRKKQNVADLETFLASPRVQVFPLDADTAQKIR